MVEYVYARHDFAPEHDDEISFRAGERIEVIARDDQFSDGWWEVRSFSSSLSAPRLRPSPLPRSSIPFPTQPRPHGVLEATMGMLEFYVSFPTHHTPFSHHGLTPALM